MCEAVKKHGLITRNSSYEECNTITAISTKGVFFLDSLESYEEFMNNDIWLDDNTPCGVMEDLSKNKA